MKLPALQDTSMQPVGAFSYHGEFGLLFRKNAKTTKSLWLFTSKDGISFSPEPKKVTVTSAGIRKEQFSRCFGFHVSAQEDAYVMTYIRRVRKTDRLITARSKDMLRWKIIGASPNAAEHGMVVPNYQHRGEYVFYYGDMFVSAAFSKNLKQWRPFNQPLAAPRQGFFDSVPLTIMGSLQTPAGTLVLYDASYVTDTTTHVQVGGILFSAAEPLQVLWRSEMPLWKNEISGTSMPEPLDIVVQGQTIHLYWHLPPDGQVLTAAIPNPFLSKKAATAQGVRITRYAHNPILSPRPQHEWESEGAFNPAALYEDGDVHLLYRAIGNSGLSMFGYASSKDGVTIDRRPSHPVYVPRTAFEGVNVTPTGYSGQNQSGGGWGGCEDPKLTAIEDRIYLTYVAHNGSGPPRAAISSISREDFMNRQWQWEMPTLISPPRVVTKSAAILPEKIRGKYVIFHRIFPDILIDFRDDLTFNNKQWLQDHARIRIRPSYWDSRKLSVGATPLKTDLGWLVIYHAVDDRDPAKYKMGAMVLDLEDPSKVLYRTKTPILSPEEPYENDWKPGIVYPCGAVIIDGQLLVYYGGGDKFVCVASAPLDRFLWELSQEKDSPITLTRIRV